MSPELLRTDGRRLTEMRPVGITPGYLAHAEGSALVELGRTKVLCAVSVENRVPAFLRGEGKGWITAEYGMLPRSTHTRSPREAVEGRQSGRTQEIQRIIGRSLRAVADLSALGERTLVVDCDVIQADGGTRTAAITGAYVALAQACQRMATNGEILVSPLLSAVAATSVGVVADEILLDLNYEEDRDAEVDFNVVMTGEGQYVEVQGTAEAAPFSAETMQRLLGLARAGIRQLIEAQAKSIEALEP